MKKILFLFLYLISSNVYSLTATEAYNHCQTLLVQSGAWTQECIHNPQVPGISSGNWQVKATNVSDPTVTSLSTAVVYADLCPDGTFPPLGICLEPVDCTSGQTAQISVPEDDSGGVMVICIGGCTETADYNGCEYVVDNSTVEECYLDETLTPPNYACNYTGTTNGNVAGGGAPSGTDAVPQSNPDPCIDINGLDVCAAKDKDCALINGQEVCVVTQTNCGTISGKTVCADDPQNCGEFNGRYVCQEIQVSQVNTACMSDPNGMTCLSGSEGVKTDSSSSTVDNGDGTTTTTTTTSTNVIGTSEYSTTTTSNNTTGAVTNKTTTGKDPDSQKIDLLPLKKSVDALGSKIDTVSQNQENIFDTSGLSAGIDSTQALSNLDIESQIIIDGLGTDQVNESDFLSTLFTWPTGTCTSIPFVFNHAAYGVNLNYDFDPCSKLAIFRAMFGWFLYIATVIFIFHIATRKTA